MCGLNIDLLIKKIYFKIWKIKIVLTFFFVYFLSKSVIYKICIYLKYIYEFFIQTKFKKKKNIFN